MSKVGKIQAILRDVILWIVKWQFDVSYYWDMERHRDYIRLDFKGQKPLNEINK